MKGYKPVFIHLILVSVFLVSCGNTELRMQKKYVARSIDFEKKVGGKLVVPILWLETELANAINRIPLVLYSDGTLIQGAKMYQLNNQDKNGYFRRAKRLIDSIPQRELYTIYSSRSDLQRIKHLPDYNLRILDEGKVKELPIYMAPQDSYEVEDPKGILGDIYAYLQTLQYPEPRDYLEYYSGNVLIEVGYPQSKFGSADKLPLIDITNEELMMAYQEHLVETSLNQLDPDYVRVVSVKSREETFNKLKAGPYRQNLRTNNKHVLITMLIYPPGFQN